ncbi:MAG TPA: response regulator transcription factor [Verrucomicrobiae bacterium]|jgi:two-component system nitrate/nitrite response regulator NarL|nr:response regulator transcription factor [Verrucomicrobiae bacterium]
MPPKTSRSHVLIVDDHTLFRESVTRLLQAEHDLEVRHCGSVQEGIAIIGSWPTDVVLLDFDLGNETGSSFLAKARAAGFQGKTLLLTAGVNELEAADLIRRGICGIVLKHSSPAELFQSIREALAGKVWFEQGYLKRVMERASASEGSAAGARTFTERERQVLSFVFEGLANKQIADRLHVSESSVKASLQQLFDKTGVRTRSQLVRVALEHYKDQL